MVVMKFSSWFCSSIGIFSVLFGYFGALGGLGLPSAFAEGPQSLLEKDVFFEPGGGVRGRYFLLQDGTAGATDETGNRGEILHRFQVDLLMHKGEFFQTFARLIHFDQWGRQSGAGDTSAGQRDSFTANNGLFVNQAWGLWKITESLGMRFGRSPIVLGSGRTYGANEWFDLPYAFDNFQIFWDWESVKVSLIGAKAQELSQISGQTLKVDPEENHFILDVDVDTGADWVKMLDFHLVQVNRDVGSADGGISELSGLNVQRFGVDFAFQTRNFTGEVYFGFVSGDEERNGESGTVNQSVTDIKLNYNVVSWSNMNIYGIFHADSGDDDINDDNLSNNDNRHFDGFYYDVYGRSGRMEFIRWGNLQAAGLGFDIEATSTMTLGAELWKFQKAKARDSMEFGQAGRLFQEAVDNGSLVFGDDKQIGTELDIFFNFEFPSQVKMGITYGAFLPGGTFKSAIGPSGVAASSTIHQLISEISIFF